MTAPVGRVALLGLGEVGRVLAEDLAAAHPQLAITAWDIAFTDPASRASANARDLELQVAADAAGAVAGVDLIFSAVTAANDLVAAGSVVDGIDRGTWFVDLNSASPNQKRQAGEIIEAAGGRYVEAAVMSPIEPLGLASPMLLGGPHAAAFTAVARDLGLTRAEFYADAIGPASATKLCRSIVVKGFEALITESMLTARTWGVETAVLASLINVLPAADWAQLAEYMISRSLEHGQRRSEEMDEAAGMVAATGLDPLMSSAIARRQEWAGHRADALTAGGLIEMLDAIRKANA